MSRVLFLSRLRQGLTGLSPEEIGDIVGDYDAHFSDAAQAGRSEADVAASLGDPLQLGRELRVEAKLRTWEARRNPRTFLRAGFGLLQAFTLAVLLPVVLALLLLAGFAAYVLAIVGATGLHLLSGMLSGGGNVLVPSLVGLGLICGVVGGGALIAGLLDSGMRLLGRYARAKYRLLKPDADETEED
jgi:uncharacterized membrane protein